MSQPSLYAEEHAILDSMDLPILPSSLPASERVRIIIDTLRKSRGNKSRPSTPMNVEFPMGTPTNVKADAPSIPSVPVPFFTSVPPGFSSQNQSNVPEAYRPIKPHTRPHKKNSGERSSLIGSNIENPFKEENIDVVVSSMIENVLNHGMYSN